MLTLLKVLELRRRSTPLNQAHGLRVGAVCSPSHSEAPSAGTGKASCV